MGSRARACALVCVAVVAAVAVGCGGDDDGGERMVEYCTYSFDAGPEAGPEAGVASGCPVRQVCDISSVEPRCICQEGYEGSDCTSCERGFRSESLADGGIACHPLPIDCSTNPCGNGGECLSIGGTDRCQCEAGYEGRLCSRCAFGFQDNDGDGVCEPGCRLSGLRCPGRRECGDLSGEVECVCIEGFTGESCDTCAPGYRPTGSGGCLATCAVAELDCGAHGACSDLDGPPRCVCDVGYAGDGCFDCAGTHRDDGMGECIGDPPSGFTLLATATGERGEPILGAVRPGGTTLVGLTTLERDVSALAHDPAGDRTWGLATGSLVEIDRHYGTVTEVTPLAGASFSAGLAWDPMRSVLYAIDSSGALISVDPLTGASAVVSTSAPGSSALSLAYDAGEDRLLAASGTSSRFSVDLGSGAIETHPPLAIDHSVERLAIAVEPTSGLPFAVGNGTQTETARLADACREIAAALRYPVPDSVLVGGYGDPDASMPGAPFTLSYEGVDPPLVVYGSYGSRSAPPRTVRIETAHPDAVVCIVTYEEVLHVVVGADARFHYLILVSYEPTLTLEVEDGFTPKIEGVPPIRVRVSDEPVDPSVMGPPDLVDFYDGSEWSALGVRADLWSSTPAYEPSLWAIDWGTSATFERAIETRAFAGGLAPFRGGP